MAMEVTKWQEKTSMMPFNCLNSYESNFIVFFISIDRWLLSTAKYYMNNAFIVTNKWLFTVNYLKIMRCNNLINAKNCF